MDYWFIFIIIVVASTGFYFIPTIIVLLNSNKQSKIPTILVNLFFGWSGIWWIISLIMAFGKDQTIIINNVYNEKDI